MRTANNWHDYIIIDTSEGEKLEKWGDITLVRPDPQIIWKTDKKESGWKFADGHYHRSNQGGGKWEFRRSLPDGWQINYKNLTFNIKPTGFKHTGLFPEQAVNWSLAKELIKKPLSDFDFDKIDVKYDHISKENTIICMLERKDKKTSDNPRSFCMCMFYL